jgi:hypothetical protein
MFYTAERTVQAQLSHNRASQSKFTSTATAHKRLYPSPKNQISLLPLLYAFLPFETQICMTFLRCWESLHGISQFSFVQKGNEACMTGMSGDIDKIT